GHAHVAEALELREQRLALSATALLATRGGWVGRLLGSSQAQRSAPRQPTGAQERRAGVARHVPRPVDERVRAEHDRQGEHGEHAYALRRVWLGPALPARTRPLSDMQPRAPRGPSAVERVR